MTTLSTDALYVQLRNRLLSYVDPDGHTLQDATVGIGGRLYRVRAPDNALFPYGVMTLRQPQKPDGDGPIKLVMDLEVLLFGRQRATQATVEAYGDRAVQALETYRDGSSGLVFFESAYSETLPPFPAPADQDIVQVRVMARMHCYPLFLSRVAT
jgi:hypothetical protein